MISVISSNVTDTVKEYTVTITERLCKPFCLLSTIKPNVKVDYTIDSTKFVDRTLYVTVKAQGVVTYVQKDGCPCNPCTKIFTEYFVVSFGDVDCTACPTIKSVDGFYKPAYVNCCGVACGIAQTDFVSIAVPAAPKFAKKAEKPN